MKNSSRFERSVRDLATTHVVDFIEKFKDQADAISILDKVKEVELPKSREFTEKLRATLARFPSSITDTSENIIGSLEEIFSTKFGDHRVVTESAEANKMTDSEEVKSVSRKIVVESIDYAKSQSTQRAQPSELVVGFYSAIEPAPSGRGGGISPETLSEAEIKDMESEKKEQLILATFRVINSLPPHEQQALKLAIRGELEKSAEPGHEIKATGSRPAISPTTQRAVGAG